MKKILFLSLLALGAISFLLSAKYKCTLDKQEAQAAFEYLNKVRQSPKDYSKEIGVSELKSLKSMPNLVWNDTLAKVAEEKAMDMAANSYFAHVNKKGEGINILIHKAGYVLPKEFLKNKKDNFFESIAMGQASGVEVIQALILDKGINPPDHRKHLLGMKEFWANCYDIGIGYARSENPQILSYTCIIIAKRGF